MIVEMMKMPNFEGITGCFSVTLRCVCVVDRLSSDLEELMVTEQVW